MESRNLKFSINIGLIVIFLSACNGQTTFEPSATISPTTAETSTSLPTATSTATATVKPIETKTPTATTISKPGTLVFSSCKGSMCAIYSINNDGSGLTKLTGDMVDIVNPQWSPDGTKILFEGNPNIYIMNADGSDLINLTRKAEGRHPDWSPDGKQIVFNSLRSGNNEIYTINVDGTGIKRLTNTPLDDLEPQWSPNGFWIAYYTTKNLSTGGWYYEICVINSDGTELKEITEGVTLRWSPDGSQIAFLGPYSNIFMIEPDGTGLKNLSNSNGYDFDFSWSPDSKLIAFATNRDNNAEIYLLCVDCEDSPQINITKSAGRNDHKPSWSPDGTQIAFLSDDTLCVMNADGSQKKCFGIKGRGTIDWKP